MFCVALCAEVTELFQKVMYERITITSLSNEISRRV